MVAGVTVVARLIASSITSNNRRKSNGKKTGIINSGQSLQVPGANFCAAAASPIGPRSGAWAASILGLPEDLGSLMVLACNIDSAV